MSADGIDLAVPHSQEVALTALASSAVANIPSVDFASITMRHQDGTLQTLAETDPRAREFDELQYELGEGPCLSAVTEERFVLVNDLSEAARYPQYGPRAAERGIRAQVAVQLLHNGEQAGLNLYSGRTGIFDRSTIQIAELFSTHAAVLIGYARQVETLGQAVHARQDIGTAVGIVMERYQIDRDRAFAYLVRMSNHRNVKVRLLAQEIIGGTLPATMAEE